MENDNAQPAEAPQNELRQRAVTAIVLIALFAVAVNTGGALWTLAMVVVAMLGAQEWQNMSRLGEFSRLWRFAAMGYIALGVTAAIAIRSQPMGLEALLLAVACVAGTDTAAYLGGKYYGSLKLLPHISPGKTWEGLAFGLLTALILGFLFALIIGGLSALHGVFLGFLLGLFSQAGDLLVSWMKRRASIKDSGNLLPGHGGILDRIDGHLASLIILGLWMLISGGHL